MKQVAIDERVVFVTGAIKTATSSVVGVLNAHPRAFIMYEAQLFNATPSKRGREFLTHFPDARHLFWPSLDCGLPYVKLRELLRVKGHEFAVIGDKIPSLDPRLLQLLGQYSVIYTVRDIRTWLAKPRVREINVTEHNLVPPAALYVTHFLESFKLPRCHHVAFEDLVLRGEETVHEIGRFVDLNLAGYAENWWQSYQRYGPSSPKRFIDWWSAHPSSAVAPTGFDVEVKVRPTPAFAELLQIFDRYYERRNRPVPAREVESDMARVSALAGSASASQEECYEYIRAQRIGVPSRSLPRRAWRRFSRTLNPRSRRLFGQATDG